MERNLLRSWTNCQLESFLYNLTEDTVINAALVDWFQKSSSQQLARARDTRNA